MITTQGQLERGQVADRGKGGISDAGLVRPAHRTSWSVLWPFAVAYGVLIACGGLAAYLLMLSR
jgi:hypothetical protein